MEFDETMHQGRSVFLGFLGPLFYIVGLFEDQTILTEIPNLIK